MPQAQSKPEAEHPISSGNPPIVAARFGNALREAFSRRDVTGG
jgi:hypothetical protein